MVELARKLRDHLLVEREIHSAHEGLGRCKVYVCTHCHEVFSAELVEPWLLICDGVDDDE